jgi:hypothetical protein
VLVAEQARIKNERAQAQEWADAATRGVEDVDTALDDALLLLDDRHVSYAIATPGVRRLVNQSIYQRLTISDPDTVEAERTPFYDGVHQLRRRPRKRPAKPQAGRKPPHAARNRASAQDDHDPLSGGRGSYIAQMAEREGFEPSNEVDPRYAISSRARSTAPAPLQALDHHPAAAAPPLWVW